MSGLCRDGWPCWGGRSSGLRIEAASGIVVGLVVGKPLGVLLAVWLMLRMGLGALPLGMRLTHLVVLGVVAGIGCTMALFVAQPAFVDEQLLAAGKIGAC